MVVEEEGLRGEGEAHLRVLEEQHLQAVGVHLEDRLVVLASLSLLAL